MPETKTESVRSGRVVRTMLTLLALSAGGVDAATDVRIPRPGLDSGFQGNVVVDPSLNSRVFATTTFESSTRLYRSDDSGQSFLDVSPGADLLTPDPALAVMSSGAVLYSGGTVDGQQGIFRSANHGQSWTRVSDTCCVYAFSRVPGQAAVFARVYSQVMRSGDDGVTWESLPSPTTPLDLAPTALAVAPTTPATVYVADSRFALYRSVDAGQTWTAVTYPTARNSIVALAVDPANSQRIFAGTYGDGLYRSDNAGQSWSAVSLPTSNRQVFSLAFDAFGTLYAGLFGWGPGLYSSTNLGASWSETATTLRDEHVIQIAPDPLVPARVYVGIDR